MGVCDDWHPPEVAVPIFKAHQIAAASFLCPRKRSLLVGFAWAPDRSRGIVALILSHETYMPV